MISELKKDAKARMQKTVDVYREDLQTIRAGRANPALLDKISVEYYGQRSPLNQVAGISVPEPRMLLIQPWDKALLPEIEKEIQVSDLGINPSNDGKVIRLVIPALTEERRKELVKIVEKNGEEAKVAIRNIRREIIDEIKKMEKNKEISEDDRFRSEDEIQEITDKYIREVDKVTESKEEELMEI